MTVDMSKAISVSERHEELVQRSRMIKAETRCVKTTNWFKCDHCNRRWKKRVKIKNGKNYTSEVGKEHFKIRQELTLIYSAVALSHGKVHSREFLLVPKNLVLLAEYMTKAKEAENATEATGTDERTEERTASVRAGDDGNDDP